jgi:hypothetical protein
MFQMIGSLCAVWLVASVATATPVTYTVDPEHTYPSSRPIISRHVGMAR